VCWIICIWWDLWAWHPPVGVWIGVLGLLGVIVPLIRDINKIGRREKAVWTFVMFALLLLEIKSVYQDRKEHDTEQADARYRETKNFETIASGIKDSVQRSEQQFETTMGKSNRIAELTQENLKNITGGASYGFVVPQTFGLSQEIPLIVWNEGGQALSGVTVTIARTQDPRWDREFFKPYFIGTIGPHSSAPLPVFINPQVDDKSGTDHYWIMISAQNGTVSEGLDFRHGKKNLPWAYSYLVTKDISRKQTMNGVLTKVTIMKPLRNRQWSDEVDAPH
jgi:hypothetical protein